MANPGLKRVQRLFLFLLITIAIVFFIVVTSSYIRRFTEGFQTTLDDLKTCTPASECEAKTIGTGSDATRVFVCRGLDAQTKAENILDCTQPYATTQIQTPVSTFLKINDGVCYEVYNTRVKGNVYYVCYERPPPLNYDPITQEVDFNDVSLYGDPVPFALTGNLPLACGLYGTNSAILARNYTSTLANYNYVTSSVTILQGTYSTIAGLQTRYCSTQTTTSQHTTCDAFAAFGTAADDPNLSNLINVRDSLSNGVVAMRNFYTSTLRPSYIGMNCEEPAIKMPF